MTIEERKRIVEDVIMTDPWTATDEDYQHFTLEDCEVQLMEMRKYNDDFNEEDQIPSDMTAQEVKELWDQIVDEHWKQFMFRYDIDDDEYEEE